MRALQILLAVDDPVIAGAVARLLGGEGHRVTAAATLAEAERLCQRQPFDAMILDVRLPAGVSWDALRRTSACKHLKVIGIGTAEGGAFDCHLPKPFDAEDLRGAIERIAAL